MECRRKIQGFVQVAMKKLRFFEESQALKEKSQTQGNPGVVRTLLQRSRRTTHKRKT